MSAVKKIRGGNGIGDAIYLQSIVRHLVEHKREDIIVCTRYPELFEPVRARVKLAPFSRQVNITAHYTGRKDMNQTTQFEDMCLAAGIHEPVELSVEWRLRNALLVAPLLGTRPLFVKMPSPPFDRFDGYGIELQPSWHVLDNMLGLLRDHYTVVQIGKGKPSYKLENIDIDLVNKTSLYDLYDLASIAEGFVGQCSFVIPLAESFNKKCLILWSAKGLASKNRYIRSIRPEKILHKATSRHVFDTWDKKDWSGTANF